MWYTYTMEYSVIKKNKIILFAGKWMEVSKVRWVQKDKRCMISLICRR
jgi:hypothetical protein